MVPVSEEIERPVLVRDRVRAPVLDERSVYALEAEVQTHRDLANRFTLALRALQIENSLDEASMSSLRVVQKPSLPLKKDGPEWIKLLCGGLFVGLFLGVGLAYLRAALDRRIHDAEELQSRFGHPVLASLPEVRLRPTPAVITVDRAPTPPQGRDLGRPKVTQ